MAEQRQNKKGVHWLIQAWVFFHLFAILTWALPDPPERLKRAEEAKLAGKPLPQPPTKQVVKDLPNYFLLYNYEYVKKSPLSYYLTSTGFWQYWNMFSPNPANVDVWLDAVVTYQDGTEMLYQYPVMQDLSATERYFKERYRKFVENTHADRFSHKWPAIAQAIAFRSYRGDGNLPIAVTLRRHFKTVMPPDEVTSPEYVEYAFFTYMVDTEKLARQVKG